MSTLIEQWDELLPELLGEQTQRAKSIRDNICQIMLTAGQKLLELYRETAKVARFSYIAESQDDEETKAFRLFLAAVDDANAEDNKEMLLLFENLTEYEAEYWLRYREKITNEWSVAVDKTVKVFQKKIKNINN